MGWDGMREETRSERDSTHATSPLPSPRGKGNKGLPIPGADIVRDQVQPSRPRRALGGGEGELLLLLLLLGRLLVAEDVLVHIAPPIPPRVPGEADEEVQQALESGVLLLLLAMCLLLLLLLLLLLHLTRAPL
jgi:hypothetical protein